MVVPRFPAAWLALGAFALVLFVAEDAEASTYWTANLPNYTTPYSFDLNGTVALSNSDSDPHDAEIYSGDGTLLATLTVPPSDTVLYQLEDQLYGSRVTDQGVYRIEAAPEMEVAVFTPIDMAYTNDAARVQRLDELGTSYIVFGYGGGIGDYVTVIAPTNGTAVTVTPTWGTLIGPGVPAMSAGVPTTVTIDAGEALHVEATSSGDLTGSIVTASNPVAVYSGNRCTNVGASACDHLSEQQLRLEAADLEYPMCATAAVRPGEYDEVRVVGAGAGPITVTLDPPVPVPSFTLAGPGDVFSFDISDHTLLTASSPVLVGQYLGKSGITVVGDPAYTILLPQARWSDQATFYVPLSWPENYIMVGGATGTTYTVDGVGAGSWDVIGSSGYSCSAHDISSGTHSLVSSSPAGIQLVGLQDFGSYWYQVGRLRSVDIIHWYGANDCVDSAVYFTFDQLGFDAATLEATWDFGDSTPPADGLSIGHTYDAPGNYTVTVTVSDSTGGSASGTLTITSIGDPNCPPVLQPPIDLVDLEGETIGQCMLASDPENDPLTFTVDNMPPGSFFIGWAACWYWASVEGDAGFYPNIVVSVTDGIDTDSDAFDVTILPPPGPEPPGWSDSDSDGVPDHADSCPSQDNAGQGGAPGQCELVDGDGESDAPSTGAPAGPGTGTDTNPPDTDLDGVDDFADNCDVTPNPLQEDLDGDGQGDACDLDMDGDGVAQVGTDALQLDNCPAVANTDQSDADLDERGDACDARVASLGADPAACGDGCRTGARLRGDRGGDGSRGLGESVRDMGARAGVPLAALAAGALLSVVLCAWALARWQRKP